MKTDDSKNDATPASPVVAACDELERSSLASVVWAEIAGLDELARKLRSPAVTLVDALVAHELEAGAKRLRRALVAEGAES